MALDQLLQRIDVKKYVGDLWFRPDLTWDHILKYPDLYDCPECLSRLAPLEYIIDHPDEPWDFEVVSNRPNLTIDFIRQFKNKLNWYELTMKFNFQDIIKNMDLPWNITSLSSNRSVTPDDIIDNPQIEWNFALLSENIDVNFIYANIHLDWDYKVLSKRVHITFISDNINLPWDYTFMSANPTLTIDFILKHLDAEWNWYSVIMNTNIPFEDIYKHNLHKNDIQAYKTRNPEHFYESYQELCCNRISIEMMEKHSQELSYGLSFNRNITMDLVIKHPFWPWDYKSLSFNKSITLQDVLDHWDKPWDLVQVCRTKY